MTETDSQHGATLQFRELGKFFGAFEAVRQFTLTVDAGEFLTLLGPSGSGKTTVLNMVAGFLNPSSGDILIGDHSIASLPTEKRNVGMVFQNYSLFPHMNVFDNVAFPLKMRYAPRAVIRERVQYALDLVHLGAHGRRRPHELSGGQRQRIAFARAIVFEPKVLLMDEPLGALDLKLREHMQLEIKHYQQEIGCTVLYVTHDQGEALTLSDRIVIMNEGKIVQIGDPQTVYDFPSTRFSAEFIGETNLLTISRDGSSAGAWMIEEIGCRFPGELTFHARLESGSLSIRPEKISRVNEGGALGAEHVIFDAVVEEAVFLGDVIRYTAKLNSGATISFKEHRTGATTIVRMNDRVRLGFSSRDVVTLAEGG